MVTEDDRPPPKTLPDLVREHTRIATGLAVAAFAILVMLITGVVFLALSGRVGDWWDSWTAP